MDDVIFFYIKTSNTDAAMTREVTISRSDFSHAEFKTVYGIEETSFTLQVYFRLNTRQLLFEFQDKYDFESCKESFYKAFSIKNLGVGENESKSKTEG